MPHRSNSRHRGTSSGSSSSSSTKKKAKKEKAKKEKQFQQQHVPITVAEEQHRSGYKHVEEKIVLPPNPNVAAVGPNREEEDARESFDNENLRRQRQHRAKEVASAALGRIRDVVQRHQGLLTSLETGAGSALEGIARFQSIRDSYSKRSADAKQLVTDMRTATVLDSHSSMANQLVGVTGEFPGECMHQTFGMVGELVKETGHLAERELQHLTHDRTLADQSEIMSFDCSLEQLGGSTLVANVGDSRVTAISLMLLLDVAGLLTNNRVTKLMEVAGKRGSNPLPLQAHEVFSSAAASSTNKPNAPLSGSSSRMGGATAAIARAIMADPAAAKPFVHGMNAEQVLTLQNEVGVDVVEKILNALKETETSTVSHGRTQRSMEGIAAAISDPTPDTEWESRLTSAQREAFQTYASAAWIAMQRKSGTSAHGSDAEELYNAVAMSVSGMAKLENMSGHDVMQALAALDDARRTKLAKIVQEAPHATLSRMSKEVAPMLESGELSSSISQAAIDTIRSVFSSKATKDAQFEQSFVVDDAGFGNVAENINSSGPKNGGDEFMEVREAASLDALEYMTEHPKFVKERIGGAIDLESSRSIVLLLAYLASRYHALLVKIVEDGMRNDSYQQWLQSAFDSV